MRRLLYMLAFFYIAGTILGGIGLGWVALHPYSRSVMPSEERNARAAAQEDKVEFRDVELTSPDGAVLRAWFMRPPEPNGDAVILLHGVSDNRMGMYGYGKWLVQNHYTVLLRCTCPRQQWRRVSDLWFERSRRHSPLGGLDRDCRTSALHVRIRRVNGSGTVVAVATEGTSILCGGRRIAVCHVSRGGLCAVWPPVSHRAVAREDVFSAYSRCRLSLCSLSLRLEYGSSFAQTRSHRHQDSGAAHPRAARSEYSSLSFRHDPGEKPVRGNRLEGARRRSHWGAQGRSTGIRTESLGMVRGALVDGRTNECPTIELKAES